MAQTCQRVAPEIVRDGSPDDLDQVAVLWHELYEHEQSQGMLLRLRGDATETWTEQMRTRLRSRTTVLLVCDVDGRVGGFLAGQLKMLGPLFEGAMAGIIQDLYVAPPYRGGGTGRRLVEVAVERFRQLDAESIEVQVAHRNEGSLAFWTAMGWRTEVIQVRRMIP